MNTSDRINAIKSLKTALKSVSYKMDINFDELVKNGSCSEFLKIYHYMFLNYNPNIASEILNKHNLELTHKTDKYFIDGIYKLFRDMLNYTPKINRDQFVQAGFTVAKCNMCSDIIDLIKTKAKSMQPTANTTVISAITNSTRSIKTSTSASSALSNICCNLKENGAVTVDQNGEEKVISPKMTNIKNQTKSNTASSILAKQAKNTLMQNHLRNQPPTNRSIKKSHSVRETTPYFGNKHHQSNETPSTISTKIAEQNADAQPLAVSTDSTSFVESILENHLKTINQTLIEINTKLVSFDNRLVQIEEQMQPKRTSSISSSSASSISMDNNEINNIFNPEIMSKLTKKIENLVSRFDLIENENKMIKQNQTNINNMVMNMNNNIRNEASNQTINDSDETTLNDYETPGNSFLNISGSQNHLLNDSNVDVLSGNRLSSNNNNQLFINAKRSSGLVQGVIQTSCNPNATPNNKFIDLDNLTFHSNDSTPTLRDDQSPNKKKFSNDVNTETDHIMKAKQLIMRATHLNEAFSSQLKI